MRACDEEMVTSPDDDSDEPLEILDLPAEIQQHILDQLDCRSRLVASQVCRLWDGLAFSGRFMDRIRLMVKVTGGS